jgi:DNA-binding CsgD family transcriptional regulator
MKELEGIAHMQLQATSLALDMILSSTDPADLCRQTVHSDLLPTSTRGCEIFYLDGKSILRSVGSYGMTTGQNDEISAWDASPMSEAIREKRLVVGKLDHLGLEFEVIAFPFITHGVPTGLMALVLEEKHFELQDLQMASEMFFKLGAFYLESLDLGNAMTSGAGAIPASPEDLSARQLIILGHIQDGLVNLEIAKELMLSESTIRQETVRIYRALGVGNRHEAVKKARALGLINKRPLPLGL